MGIEGGEGLCWALRGSEQRLNTRRLDPCAQEDEASGPPGILEFA